MSTSILERVKSKLDARQRAATSDYLALVKTIADGGKEPKAEDVATTLADAGRSIEELEDAVTRRQSRNANRARVNDLAPLLVERDDMAKVIATANAELEAAEQRHAAIVEPLFNRTKWITRREEEVAAIRRSLLDDSPDVEALQAYREAMRRKSQLSSEIYQLNATIADAGVRANRLEQEAKEAVDPSFTGSSTFDGPRAITDGNRAAATQLSTAAKAERDRLTAAHKRLPDAQAELAEVTTQAEEFLARAIAA